MEGLSIKGETDSFALNIWWSLNILRDGVRKFRLLI
jgi:hypothetical protein